VADHTVTQLKERGDPWRLRGGTDSETADDVIGWKVFPAPPTPHLPSLKPRSIVAGPAGDDTPPLPAAWTFEEAMRA
jgi:hypothetical protein